MAENNVVQINNLNNGQWPDLFAFSDSEPSTVSFAVVDATENYFSTQKEVERVGDRTFSDRTKSSKISNSTIATNFFLDRPQKSRATTSGYLTASIVDQYRQGVEIREPRHYSSGIFKISAGTPGHVVNPGCFGVSETYDLTGNDYFQELNLFNPIEFIQLQSEDKLIESVITFPIVTSDADQRENYILNGIIEPFPIRPVISYFSINFPFEPHGISANFGYGNPYLRISSDDVSSIQEFEPTRINKKVFLDGGDPIIVRDDAGQTQVEVGLNLAYVSTDQNYIAPFEDKIYSRGDELESTRQYESDLLAVVKRMKAQNTTYLTTNQVTGKTGFMYGNSESGTDSIAYGGLSR